MEPIVMPTIDFDERDEDLLVHTWCAEQLNALGLSQSARARAGAQ
jgi:hypothetical protein